jgi:hypothetical protein
VAKSGRLGEPPVLEAIAMLDILPLTRSKRVDDLPLILHELSTMGVACKLDSALDAADPANCTEHLAQALCGESQMDNPSPFGRTFYGRLLAASRAIFTAMAPPKSPRFPPSSKNLGPHGRVPINLCYPHIKPVIRA